MEAVGETDIIEHQTNVNQTEDTQNEAENATDKSKRRKRKHPGPKTWTQPLMDSALDAIRSETMSVSSASTIFNIPYQTLWQRVHVLGIKLPKGQSNRTTNLNLNEALDAIRSKTISIPQAATTFGIAYSTLWQHVNRLKIEIPKIRAKPKRPPPKEPTPRRPRNKSEIGPDELRFRPGANIFH